MAQEPISRPRWLDFRYSGWPLHTSFYFVLRESKTGPVAHDNVSIPLFMRKSKDPQAQDATIGENPPLTAEIKNGRWEVRDLDLSEFESLGFDTLVIEYGQKVLERTLITDTEKEKRWREKQGQQAENQPSKVPYSVSSGSRAAAGAPPEEEDIPVLTPEVLPPEPDQGTPAGATPRTTPPRTGGDERKRNNRNAQVLTSTAAGDKKEPPDPQASDIANSVVCRQGNRHIGDTVTFLAKCGEQLCRTKVKISVDREVEGVENLDNPGTVATLPVIWETNDAGELNLKVVRKEFRIRITATLAHNIKVSSSCVLLTA